jgi:hypothetical protein
MCDVQKQSESLKTRKKIFAIFSKGNYIVKLSKEWVEELNSSGDGLLYDPGSGNIMKEWVIITEEYVNKRIEYASEEKTFAKKLTK